MAIIAENSGNVQRELIPAGNYVARCYRMIQIGTIETEYLGEKKMLHKVRVGFELPLELKVYKEENGEQPLVIDKEYTLSMGEKANLRKDLQSWRGKAFTDQEASKFDITKLIGAPCMLNIIHVCGKKDPSKTYQSIAGITPLPKGFSCPESINQKQILSYDSFDLQLFESLPDFIKDQIKSSLEYKEMQDSTPVDKSDIEVESNDDDLPF